MKPVEVRHGDRPGQPSHRSAGKVRALRGVEDGEGGATVYLCAARRSRGVPGTRPEACRPLREGGTDGTGERTGGARRGGSLGPVRGTGPCHLETDGTPTPGTGPTQVPPPTRGVVLRC